MGMTDAFPRARSPELMSRRDSALLVVDVQEKLIGAVRGHRRVVWNIGRLIDGAKLLGVPIAATEQYPKGLGKTVEELASRLAATSDAALPEKVVFSCCACSELLEDFRARGVGKVLLAGIEAHVCVQQTAFDLLSEGYRVYVAADAVGSRHAVDYEFALRRMEMAGAALTTTEAALFEWCEAADAPEFKQLSTLVRQAPPTES
jgi:nicotinamidase-related amidase